MSLVPLAQTTLPDDNTGYVVAAYLILFALVFAYFAIMAVKLARIERELVELNALAAKPPVAAEESGSKVPAS